MATTNTEVKRDEKTWEVEVKAEITPESLDTYRTETLVELQKTAKLDGFRPGKVPQERIIGIYGDDAIMRLAAERAIQGELPEILAKEQLLIIESPKVTTDSPVLGKSLSFTARAAMAPKVELADYAKIAKSHTDTKEIVAVTDKEQADAVMHIRRERARIDKIEAGVDSQKAAEESRAMKEDELPAIDDAFAQSIGYENAESFFTALRSNMQNEKEMQAVQKRRGTILDELAKESKINYPVTLREYELDDIESRFAEDLGRSGATMEQYMKDTKKTREELRKSWEDGADMRVKVRLLLAEIARIEKIEPPTDVVDHELQHALEHYPKADPEALRANVIHALRNEQTLRFLEGNTEPVGHTGHNHS
jgi:FKBP-type peptidyl-prolyl cis-trans isomerase (trigger factor)